MRQFRKYGVSFFGARAETFESSDLVAPGKRTFRAPIAGKKTAAFLVTSGAR
jgi:hypothetical protein